MSIALGVIISTLLALATIGFALQQLVAFVRGDGARQARTSPPRSHHLDPFDPRSRTS